MWWWVVGGYTILLLLFLRANYVLGDINKNMDDVAEKYFKELKEKQDKTGS